MIFTTKNGESFDTENDLSSAERHVLQKLFLWNTMATSLQQFREKKEEALRRGWNNLGPLRESAAMKKICADLEEKVLARLSAGEDP